MATDTTSASSAQLSWKLHCTAFQQSLELLSYVHDCSTWCGIYAAYFGEHGTSIHGWVWSNGQIDIKEPPTQRQSLLSADTTLFP